MPTKRLQRDGYRDILGDPFGLLVIVVDIRNCSHDVRKMVSVVAGRFPPSKRQVKGIAVPRESIVQRRVTIHVSPPILLSWLT